MIMQQPERPLIAAANWLLAFLRDGPQPAAEVHAAAQAEGHSLRTLNRTKRLSGVRSFKCGYRGPWFWVHPMHTPAFDRPSFEEYWIPRELLINRQALAAKPANPHPQYDAETPNIAGNSPRSSMSGVCN